MSFNGSGTFLINSTGQPVVTGTVISSTAFNSLTADLGTGLSTTITKDGQTTTTAKIPFAFGLSAAAASNFAAGTVGLPAIYLSTDTTTGLYRIGANNDGFAVSGAKVLDIASTGLAVTGTLSASGAATLSSTLAVTGAVVCSAGSGYTFKGAGVSTSAMFSGRTANATDFEWGPDIGVSSIWRVQNGGGTGVYLTSGNTAWTANSDERLKNIAGEFTGALDFIVSKVRTVRGTWKADETKRSRSFLIAQDWEDYLPEGIEVSADGILGLTKEDTIPVAFAAIKELAAMVKNLTARLAALEAK